MRKISNKKSRYLFIGMAFTCCSCAQDIASNHGPNKPDTPYSIQLENRYVAGLSGVDEATSWAENALTAESKPSRPKSKSKEKLQKSVPELCRIKKDNGAIEATSASAKTQNSFKLTIDGNNCPILYSSTMRESLEGKANFTRTTNGQFESKSGDSDDFDVRNLNFASTLKIKSANLSPTETGLAYVLRNTIKYESRAEGSVDSTFDTELFAQVISNQIQIKGEILHLFSFANNSRATFKIKISDTFVAVDQSAQISSAKHSCYLNSQIIDETRCDNIYDWYFASYSLEFANATASAR